ncbi:unnamed protein product, partial [Rotaria sp. Silwood1]
MSIDTPGCGEPFNPSDTGVKMKPAAPNERCL